MSTRYVSALGIAIALLFGVAATVMNHRLDGWIDTSLGATIVLAITFGIRFVGSRRLAAPTTTAHLRVGILAACCVAILARTEGPWCRLGALGLRSSYLLEVPAVTLPLACVLALLFSRRAAAT
jgi:uncharacterized membrane protein (UPF0136 family)